jgi:hypothetical protein
MSYTNMWREFSVIVKQIVRLTYQLFFGPAFIRQVFVLI